jgi:hypothetical protein
MAHTIMFGIVGFCAIFCMALFTAHALRGEGYTVEYTKVYLKGWFFVAVLAGLFAAWLWQLSGG